MHSFHSLMCWLFYAQFTFFTSGKWLWKKWPKHFVQKIVFGLTQPISIYSILKTFLPVKLLLRFGLTNHLIGLLFQHISDEHNFLNLNSLFVGSGIIQKCTPWLHLVRRWSHPPNVKLHDSQCYACSHTWTQNWNNSQDLSASLVSMKLG